MAERARLERAAAVYRVVAVRLLRLTDLARQELVARCEQELTPVEWPVLEQHARQAFPAQGPAVVPPTLAAAVGWLARLGGSVGRGQPAQPGVKVLWRGLRGLSDLVAGYHLARHNAHDPPNSVQRSVER